MTRSISDSAIVARLSVLALAGGTMHDDTAWMPATKQLAGDHRDDDLGQPRPRVVGLDNEHRSALRRKKVGMGKDDQRDVTALAGGLWRHRRRRKRSSRGCPSRRRTSTAAP